MEASEDYKDSLVKFLRTDPEEVWSYLDAAWEDNDPAVFMIAFAQVAEVYILEKLTHYFGNDDKVEQWLNTVNPLCGGVSPMELIKEGRPLKVLKIVTNLLVENINFMIKEDENE